MMKKKRFAILVLALLMLALAALASGCKKKNPLIGNWQMDSVTSYEFRKDGTGSMNLPLSQNPFTYVIEDGKVTIQFEDSALETRSYTYTVEGDTMTLVYHFGNEQKAYTLTRKAK